MTNNFCHILIIFSLFFPVEGSTVGLCKLGFLRKTNLSLKQNKLKAFKYLRNKNIKREIETATKLLGKDFSELKVTDLVEMGFPISTASLSALGIPRVFHKHYSRSTGEFKYVQHHARPLEKENGDTPLSILRINVLKDHQAFREHLISVTEVLKVLPNIKLIIISRAKGSVEALEILNLLDLPKSVRNRIMFSSGERKYSPTLAIGQWARDDFTPMKGGDLLMPKKSFRPLNLMTNEAMRIIKRKLKTNIVSSAFIFDGGNLVVSEKTIFIGTDTIMENAQKLRASFGSVVKALEMEFGKKVTPVGVNSVNGIKQVDYHIDLTLAAVRDYTTGNEIVFLGSAKKASELLDQEANPRSQKLRDFLKSSLVQKREERMEVVRRDLESQGYTVELLPNLFSLKLQANAYNANEKLGYVPFNYTNVVAGKGEMLIPEFGIEVLDQYVHQRFSDLGYNTHGLKSGKTLMKYSGGVRCATCAISASDQNKGQ